MPNPGGAFSNSGAYGQGGRVQGSVTSNAAVQGIVNSLNNPNRGSAAGGFPNGSMSGGMNQQGTGLPGQQGQQGTGVMGPGLIGVASKYEGGTIMVYNEKSSFEEWEFVFDAKKAAEMSGAKTGQQGQQGQQPGQQNRNGGFGSSSGSTGAAGNASSWSGSGSSSGSGFSFGGMGGGQTPAPGGFGRR